MPEYSTEIHLDIHTGIRSMFVLPQSHWLYHPQLDVCTWLMELPPRIENDLRVMDHLRTQGREVAPLDLLPTLMSQFADMDMLQIVGAANWWVQSDDIIWAQRCPVQLAFSITSAAHDLLPDLPHQEDGRTMLPLTNRFPPPNWGEHALVDIGQGTWQLYHLAATGDEGFALWEQIGRLLQEIASPMGWMLFSEIIPQAAAYDQVRAVLDAQLATAKGKWRRELREQLAQLDEAREQVQAMDTWQKESLADVPTYAERWLHLRELARSLSLLYWEAHQRGVQPTASTDVGHDDRSGTEQEQLGILLRIPEPRLAASLVVPTYQEDRAAREASLVAIDRWSREKGVHRFRASNHLVVFLGSPDAPIAASEAQTYLAQRSQSTALTARVVLGLWNLRRNDQQLTWKGGAGIRIDEILEWRGYARQRIDNEGTAQYRAENRELIRRDMRILSNYFIKGRHTVRVQGKPSSINVSGQYLMATEITQTTLWGEEETVGYFVTPGDWILSYEEAGNIYLTEVDRRIFELQPQNEQHLICLALYLVERWREQYAHGTYDEPITMQQLLNESIIEIDKRNLTGRFVKRIEDALAVLHKRKILGDYSMVGEIDKSKRNWGADWLAAKWRLAPPVTRQAPRLIALPHQE